MKKLLCVLMSVLLLGVLFAGCKGETAAEPTEATLPEIGETTQPTETTVVPDETSPSEIGAINYKGIVGKEVTPAYLEAAEGRPMDAETLAGEDTMYIYRDVEYLGTAYSQLQCILYGDHTSITLTYKLKQSETVDSAMASIATGINELYGEPNVSTGEMASFTWRNAAENDNYLNLYELNDTELKLCFNLY